MPQQKGDYFKNKEEAIEFYRNNEENLKDKPDWMIECMIDFAIQYPDYKEYCEVEARVTNGKPLTSKQKKKYGHLQWEKSHQEFKNGDVIYDAVESHKAGEYDDIINDKEAFEKINKYNIAFNKDLQQEPADTVHFVQNTPDGKYKAEAPLDQVIADAKEGGLKEESWTFEKLDDDNKSIKK